MSPFPLFFFSFRRKTIAIGASACESRLPPPQLGHDSINEGRTIPPPFFFPPLPSESSLNSIEIFVFFLFQFYPAGFSPPFPAVRGRKGPHVIDTSRAEGPGRGHFSLPPLSPFLTTVPHRLRQLLPEETVSFLPSSFRLSGSMSGDPRKEAPLPFLPFFSFPPPLSFSDKVKDQAGRKPENLRRSSSLFFFSERAGGKGNGPLRRPLPFFFFLLFVRTRR